MRFFTLLHIAEKEKSAQNNKSGTFSKQIEIYVKCIKLLSATLNHQGYSLTVLTNNKSYLVPYFGNFNIEIDELSFTLNVPSGVRFFSAHYKNEAYKYFGTLQDDYIALIDSDMICINKMPPGFRNCIENGIALYYDISNQVFPAFGEEVVIKDKQIVDKTAKVGLWAGGEFIGGTPEFFRSLHQQIEEFSPAYFENVKKLHHQGSEVLNSIAIENGILNKRYVIFDAGSLNIICRYWNFPTRHPQPSFNTYKDCFFVHLPSAKKLMADININKLDMDHIFDYLKPRISVLYFAGSIVHTFRKLRKKPVLQQ